MFRRKTESLEQTVFQQNGKQSHTYTKKPKKVVTYLKSTDMILHT